MQKLKISKDRTPAVLRKIAKAETDASVAQVGDRRCSGRHETSYVNHWR
jgi:hypothetical protein